MPQLQVPQMKMTEARNTGDQFNGGVFGCLKCVHVCFIYLIYLLIDKTALLGWKNSSNHMSNQRKTSKIEEN